MTSTLYAFVETHLKLPPEEDWSKLVNAAIAAVTYPSTILISSALVHGFKHFRDGDHCFWTRTIALSLLNAYVIWQSCQLPPIHWTVLGMIVGLFFLISLYFSIIGYMSLQEACKIMIVAPILEELYYRHYICSVILGEGKYTVYAAFLFALAHVHHHVFLRLDRSPSDLHNPQGTHSSNGIGNAISQILFAMWLGLGMTGLFLPAMGLICCIIIHGAVNGFFWYITDELCGYNVADIVYKKLLEQQRLYRRYKHGK